MNSADFEQFLHNFPLVAGIVLLDEIAHLHFNEFMGNIAKRILNMLFKQTEEKIPVLSLQEYFTHSDDDNSFHFFMIPFSLLMHPFNVSAAVTASFSSVSGQKLTRRAPSRTDGEYPHSVRIRLWRCREEQADPVPITTPRSSAMCCITSPRSPFAEKLTI